MLCKRKLKNILITILKNLLYPSKPWETEFRLSMLQWDNSWTQSIVLMSFKSKLTAFGSTFNKSESKAQV